MLIVVILIMVPIFWMLSGSLKTNQEILTFPPQWLPTDPQWSNYTGRMELGAVRAVLHQHNHYDTCRDYAGADKRLLDGVCVRVLALPAEEPSVHSAAGRAHDPATGDR